MMLKIAGVLDAAGVRAVRDIIDPGPWVDGGETAGHQSRHTKRNRQLRRGSDEAARAGKLILEAIGAAPEFIAAALPLKVFPPSFNAYSGGEEFGAHVDNSVLHLGGSDFRIRGDLSCTLFLEPPEDYEGGELVVEDLFGEHRVKLAAGDLVLYPASSIHRVTPVESGDRVAAFFWIQSMVRDHGEREKLYRLDHSIRTLSMERGPTDRVVMDLTSLYHNLLRSWADV